jgi:hypothetical protein
MPTELEAKLTVPPGMSKESRAAWAELLKAVGNRAKPEDASQLEQLAVWLAKWRLVIVSLDAAVPGTTEFSRLVSAASTSSQNFDRIAKKFGLAPLDRAALNIPVDGGNTNGAIRW